MWDALWINATVATMAAADYGLIRNGAIALRGGRIVWVGEAQSLSKAPEKSAYAVFDADGRVVTPGLIDLPNTFLLPHLGSATVEDRVWMMEIAVNNVIAALKGEPLPHAIEM